MMTSISATTAVGLQSAQTQTELSAAILKQADALEQQLAETLEKSVEAAPSPGTGQLLDRRV